MAQKIINYSQQPLFENLKKSALMHDLLSMPKLDLHRHLTGSIDAEMAVRIAAKYDVKLPTYISSELEDMLFKQDRVKNLDEYFHPWAVLNRLFISKEAVYEIVMLSARKAAQDRVLYVEFRTSPRGFLGENNAFSFEEYVETLSKSAIDAQSEFDIIIRFILGIPRQVFVPIPLIQRNRMFAKMISVILAYGQHFVGVDLSGNEDIGAEEFEYFFRFAMEKGLSVTVHAGESGPASNVRYAVEHLGASRIGHGISAAKDETLLSILAERCCTLEICPTSNKLLGVVSEVEELPLKMLWQHNVPFIICSDNPARCRISLSEELYKVSKAFDLSIHDVEKIVHSSLDSSFADSETKRILSLKLGISKRTAGNSADVLKSATELAPAN